MKCKDCCRTRICQISQQRHGLFLSPILFSNRFVSVLLCDIYLDSMSPFSMPLKWPLPAFQQTSYTLRWASKLSFRKLWQPHPILWPSPLCVCPLPPDKLLWRRDKESEGFRIQKECRKWCGSNPLPPMCCANRRGQQAQLKPFLLSPTFPLS